MTHVFEAPPSMLRYDDGQRRLVLRPARVADTEEVVAAIAESLAELRAFMPWAHMPQTEAVQRRRMTELEAELGQGHDLILHLFEGEGGPFVGCLGLHGARSLNPMCAEIGYWVRSGCTGRGIVTLAVRCAIVYAFETLGLNRIQCGYNEANLASARVNAKAGFEVEGRLRFFEGRPTAQARADGSRMGPCTVMTALFPEDRGRLTWYSEVAASLTVL